MPQPIAVLTAMEEEISQIRRRLHRPVAQVVGGHRYLTGSISGSDVVTAVSGYGKVSAAATVTSLLDAFSPRYVVFGGVAGGIGPDVAIGDVVVADRLIQHDLDASPIFDRYVVPSLGIAQIASDPDLTAALAAAATAYVEGPFRREVASQQNLPFAAEETSVHVGLIASGDQFIHDQSQAEALAGELPTVLAVEMEGAAVAQVCAERGVPFGVFRSISDRADLHADVDFLAFIDSVAAPMTAGVVDEVMARLGT